MGLVHPHEVLTQLEAAQAALLSAFDAVSESLAKLESVQSDHPVWSRFNECKQLMQEPSKRYLRIVHHMNGMTQETIDAIRVSQDRRS